LSATATAAEVEIERAIGGGSGLDAVFRLTAPVETASELRSPALSPVWIMTDAGWRTISPGGLHDRNAPTG
jgi:hypothetical protein